MRILSRLAVFLLVVIALTVSFARYLLPPLIETYKDEILAQVSLILGKRIEADAVSVFWREDGHGFHLQNLRLVNDDGSSDLKTKSVYLKFSVMEVIRHLNIAPSEIRVVGTHLAVIRHEDGKVSIHGIEHSDDFDVDLSSMILQPVFLEFVDSEVTLIDLVHKNTLPLHFTPVNLLIQNDGNQHHLSARVSIDKGDAGGFTLISQFQTESKNLEQWQGEVYLRTKQLDLAWLLQNRFPGHYNLEHAKTSMEIWSHWEKGRLLTLQGLMYSEDLHFRSQNVKEAPELALDYFGGKFHWRREQNGWLLDIADPVIRHEDAVWPTKSIGIAVRQISGKGPLHFYIGADILSIDGLFKALAIHPPDHPFMKDLFAAQAQGEVLNPSLHLKMHHPIEWEFNATLEKLETNAAGILPEIKGIRVMVAASHDSGSVKIAGSNASLYIKSLFREPMLLDQVTGELRWKKQPDGSWRIVTDNLVAQTEHIKTTTSFRYTLPPQQGKGHLDLLTHFQEGHARHASIYYPAHMMPPAVVEWLDRSLTKGFITSGYFVLQGALQSFPFENNNDGFYEVVFDIQDAEIAYKEEWPPLEHVKARVRFHGNHLNIDVSEGTIYDNRVAQASMQMQLNPASAIYLQGDISGSLAGPVRLLRETPLKSQFAPLMESLDMQGDGDLSVDMQIPLKKHHAAAFKGDLLLKDATINAKDVDVSLQGVNGMLHITDSGVSAKNLKARLLGSPLSMSIKPLKSGPTLVKADVNLSAASLKRVIADAPVSGTALWRIDVEVPSLARMRRSGLSLHTRSDLKGMRVDLPLSLEKSRSQKKVFDLVWELSETTPAFKLLYGDLKMDMKHRQGAWRGAIKAKELSGKLMIPDAKQQQIRVDLERLNLVFSLHDKSAPVDNKGPGPHDIRPLYLTSERLLLNGRPFGTLSMKTRHTRSGHEMTELKVNSHNDKLVASGNWNQKKGGSTTDVSISLVAEEIGETLKSLDLSNQLEEAQGSIDADLNWKGSPADYTLNRLNGSLLVDTRKGRFSEAQPGLARILGFLNIGALKRRLQLDFSDLTKKGFSFDEMRGRFVLNRGVVSTKKELVIKAPAADIHVSGDLDLGTRRVNQRIRVIPDIHGVLPLAGVAAGGPAVGAALLVAGVVAGKQIDQLAEINYSVKGSLDNPDVVRVARKKLFGGSQRQRLVQPFVDAVPDSSNEKQSWRSESSENPIGKKSHDPTADLF